VVYQPPVADFHVEAFDSIKVQPDRTFKFINRSVFPPLTYRWDFGDGSSASSEENPTHTYPDTGRYAVSLIVGNVQGCLDTMIRHVRIDTAECYLWIPTAFMPDQKQLRDEVQYFRAVGKNLQSFRITVFNKWGEVVFESDKLDDGKPIEFWNGINQRTGEECKQDVYVWRVEATFVNGDVWPGQEEEFGILKKSGTVTLIR
jgi:PKD repeat protein